MSRLGQLISIETLKTRKRLALWVTTGIFTFLCVIGVLMPLVNAIRGQGGGPPFALPFVWRGVFQLPAGIGPLFLGVLMILLLAPEFGWKTARQNVIDGLSREQFYLGKLIVLAQLLLVFLLVPVVIGIVAVLVSPDEGTGTFAAAPDLNRMLGYLLQLALWGSAAFMLGALIRAAGAAAGAMLLYYLVENILRSLVGFWRPELETWLDFLPTGLFATLNELAFYYPDELARRNEMLETIGAAPLEFPDFWVVTVAGLAWVVLFLAVAFVNTHRRDL